MMWILIIVGSLLSAYLWRAGGMGSEDPINIFPKWIRQSWVRDWLCPLIMCIIIGLTLGWTWWLILVYLLSAAASSTYWDFI
jgi:hypothetical protein